MIRSTTRLLVALAIVAAIVAVPVRMAWSAPQTRLVMLAGADDAGGEEVPFPASHVGLRWSGDENAVVQVRWAVDGTWRPWEDVTVAHDLEDRRRRLVYSGLVRTDGASKLQTRVVSGQARSVKVVAIDTENGDRRLVRAEPPPAAASITAPRVAQPAVVTRAQWGADELLRAAGPPAVAPVAKLIVHHTATTNNDPDPAATIRAIYAFHTQTRGWDDIGYNFLVDARGRVYEGRFARTYAPGEVPTGEDVDGNAVIGAHAEGVNTGSVGIALLGDFTAASPTSASVDGLKAMLAWETDRHDLDPTASSPYTRVADGSVVTFPNIAGHRDTRATDCPGDSLYSRLPEIRAAMPRPLPRSPAGAQARTVAVGYWTAGRDGAVRGFGNAPLYGDVATLRLNSPLQAMAATPPRSGAPSGYWLLGGDGGIFAFGDAGFFGSTGAIRLNQPVVGMAPTPTGRGYWLVASDGGIFAFGDARFLGSTGAIRLNSPIVGMDVASRGGYWLVARDGGVFAFGAPFLGSVPGLRLPSYAGSVSLAGSPGGAGYQVLGSDGGVFSFGDAVFFGAHPGLTGASAAADMALATVVVPAG